MRNPLFVSMRHLCWFIILTLSLSACFHPPFNNFKRDAPHVEGTIIGAGMGTLVGGLAGGTLIGLAIGGTAGTLIDIYHANKPYIIQQLQKEDIQYIKYGDTMTLVVPTDRYFLFNSSRLNDRCYQGLNNIVKLLKFYPRSRIYVAGFTDDVGSKEHKRRLSQAQAETMLGLLWANNIPAQHLHAKGYSDKYTLGQNSIIHGSAYNRRIEIQWFNVEDTEIVPMRLTNRMK